MEAFENCSYTASTSFLPGRQRSEQENGRCPAHDCRREPKFWEVLGKPGSPSKMAMGSQQGRQLGGG